VKPLKYTYEKEIVMYAYFRKLVYFSTECVFAPNAYRGHARMLLKDLEKVDPAVIMNIIQSGEFEGAGPEPPTNQHARFKLSGIVVVLDWLMAYFVVGESLTINATANMPTLSRCTRCGYVSSQEVCKACVLLEGLNKGLPRLGIGKSSKVKRFMQEKENSPCCKTQSCLCNKK
jgi:cytoplasmic tRNA 2-thiolation protein 1